MYLQILYLNIPSFTWLQSFPSMKLGETADRMLADYVPIRTTLVDDFQIFILSSKSSFLVPFLNLLCHKNIPDPILYHSKKGTKRNETLIYFSAYIAIDVSKFKIFTPIMANLKNLDL